MRLMIQIPECPNCGDPHDPRPCATKGATCDCCFSMYPVDADWFAACDALDLAVQG